MSHRNFLTQSLQAEAERQGFELSGVAPAAEPMSFSHFDQWINDDHHGEMDYMKTRRDAYRHPRFVMEEAVSVMMLAMVYRSESSNDDVDPASGRLMSGRPMSGRIAKYARGSVDYHDYIHHRLKALCRFAQTLDPDLRVRGVVDTAPLLERDFAKMAGLGWAAKNTMLINRQFGSYFFLAALIVNQPLEYDSPFEKFHCGTCTACIDACPTDAFVSPHVLDARRCISYLTIEHRSPIDPDLRSGMGDWILGCDVCQDVCPWNRKAPATDEPAFVAREDLEPLDLPSLFSFTDDQFRAQFRKTPLWRPRRRGILRNAAIALGNEGRADSVTPLTKGLHDEEPLVRGASAWALRKIGGELALERLQDRRNIECDEYVVSEIDGTFDGLSEVNA